MTFFIDFYILNIIYSNIKFVLISDFYNINIIIVYGFKI